MKGIGWLPSGFSDAMAISRIEWLVKTRGCAMIAMETARVLGGNLKVKDILDIVEQGGRVYEIIPQLVHQQLQQPK